MMEGAPVVDPSNFMDLMDDKVFHSSLDSTLLDNTKPDSATSSTSSALTQNQGQQMRPEIVDWSPQDGQVGDSVTIVLKQPSHSALPSMKICFNNTIMETNEHHQEKENQIWVTLVTKVPPLDDAQKQDGGEKLNQTPVAVCIYDPAKQQPLQFPIGNFTYLQGSSKFLK
jgi:hypothetical protein